MQGSDWLTLYIRKTSSPHKPTDERGKDHGRLPDVVRFCRFFVVSWTGDSKGEQFSLMKD